jgi:hypothetical protein
MLAAEKRHMDARMAAIQRLAFTDDVVDKAGKVLETLLDSPNDKERRLAAERIRDERGLTRVSKPEITGPNVSITLNTPWRDGSSLEQRAPPKRVGRSSVWSNQAKSTPTQAILPTVSDNGDSVGSAMPGEMPTPPVPPKTPGSREAS